MASKIVGGLLGSNNRNIAIYGNLIIDTSVDDHLFALDATTGEMVWETQVLDYRKHPAIQGAGPIIANGKAVSGRSCLPQGGPHACVIVALDAMTGEGGLAAADDSGHPANPATRAGAISPSRSATTSAPGWCRATTTRWISSSWERR